MAQDSFRIKRSANIQPLASPSLTEQGDIGVNSSTGKIQYNNGTTTSPVVTESHTATLTNKTIDADLNTISNLVDASIKAGAAIAYSKLNLSNSIVNADIASAAAIAYSKLSLSNSIVNADIASAAAIAYSKLALSNSIVNADIATGANIDVAKLGALTASRALETNGSGVITPSTVTSTELGYLSGVTSSIQTQLGNKADTSALTAHTGASSGVHGVTGTVVGTSDTQTLTNKTLDAAIIDNGADFIEEASLTNPASGRRKLGLKTDGKLYLRDSSGNEVAVGTGSGGGINYILNPDAEANTTGWNTYADAAGTQPVDGTGGTANITFTRDTTTPLRNTAQFLLTKDAANRQGQGVSYDFTIDRADQAKRLTISFDYLVASGTYADGDIGVYIVDVTNGAVIQPAGFQVQNITGVAGKELATFQTASNSTSYRLCLHVASTSTSAYTLRIDNVQVGPVNATFSTPVTDWSTNWTPTGSWTTNTIYEGKWRRVGSDMEGQVTIRLTGAPNATTLTITLPNGASYDANALARSGTPLENHVGEIDYADSGSGQALGWLQPNSANTTSLICYAVNGTLSSGAVINATQPIVWANGDQIRIRFQVPIVGWSSSAQVVSDSSEGRVVAATMFAATTTSLANGTPTVVNLTSTSVDTIGGWNGSNTYTVRVPGVYSISGMVNFATNATGTRATSYRVNGVDYTGGLVASAGGAIRTRVPGAPLVLRLAAGSTIQLLGYQDSGAALNAENFESFLSIQLIQGAQTLLGGETVAATYTNMTNSGAVDSSTGNTILWSTRVQDTHGIVNTSTGVITAPVSGRYRVACQITASLGATTAAITSRIFGPTGSIIRESTTHAGSTITSRIYNVFAEAEIPLLAGQTVSIRGLAAFGNATYFQDGTLNYLHVTRVGNY